jgi:oligopeptidase B
MNLNKKNSYNDFIDCAKFLIKEGYTTKNKLVIQGGSAGGTLIGYAINNNPELFKAAILNVPALNVIESARDTSYRLQTHFINEHGNPEILKEYNYMKSYSPYQNIGRINYPSILLLSGYMDQRVRPWESAMFIAKLRSLNKSKNTVLFKTKFNAGHIGSFGKNSSLKEDAFKYAYIFELMNMK